MKEFNGYLSVWFRVKTADPGGSVVFGVLKDSPNEKDGTIWRTDKVLHFNHAKDYIETKDCRYTLGVKLEKKENIAVILEHFGMADKADLLEYL